MSRAISSIGGQRSFSPSVAGWVAGLLWAVATTTAAAQAVSEPSPPIVAVQWSKSHPLSSAGNVAVYDGQADPTGVLFAIPAGTVFSRNRIVVAATPPGHALTVRLRNDLSSRWDRVETSGADGKVELRYRTEGSATLLVQSPGGPQRFQLAIMQGHEIPVHRLMAPPFVSQESGAAASESAGPGTAPPAGGSTSVVLWVIAGLLTVLVVLVLVMMLRRKTQ